MWHAWKCIEMHTGFWWENLKERDCLEHRNVDWRTIYFYLKK